MIKFLWDRLMYNNNMKKTFYSHFIEIDAIIIELERMELSEDEKKHLIGIIHSNLHQAILDTILSELSKEDKKIFLVNLSLDNHIKIWEHLKNKIENVEKKVENTAEKLKMEFHKDINWVRKK